MQLTLAYRSPSFIASEALTRLHFAPNLKRTPTYFESGLRDPLLVRDALLNLHDLVVSDFDTRLTAQQLAAILDPVVTVAHDQVYFEAFSQDESSYGRVALREGALQGVERWESGTTNVDFTPQLAAALGGIRSSSAARFTVDPDAFAVSNNGAAYREKKVKLPPSWLRGFLNVQTAMTGELTSFELSRADLRALLAWMKAHKEQGGPRALVFKLRPGEKIELLWEPWNHKQVLSGSVYRGAREHEVRVFGRRRLALLNRTLPKMSRLRVFLAGSGQPSFWLADLGREDASFLCAISGWTTRPFTSPGLHLSESQEKVEVQLLGQARALLRADELLASDDLAQRLNLAPAHARRVMALLCGQGQAMFDLETRRYRKREVVDVPLDDLGLEPDEGRLTDAHALVREGRVKVESCATTPFHTAARGEVRGTQGTYATAVTLQDDKIVDGDCQCTWFRYNALRGGPCKHILALREAVTQAGSEVASQETEWWNALLPATLG